MDGVYKVHGLLLFFFSKFGMVSDNFVPKRCLRLFAFGFLGNLTLSQHSHFLSPARVDVAYKRKSEKIQQVDLDFSDRSKLDGSDAC